MGFNSILDFLKINILYVLVLLYYLVVISKLINLVCILE